MEVLELVLNDVLDMVIQLWTACSSGAFGIFGFFVIGIVVLRVLAKAYNKIKG